MAPQQYPQGSPGKNKTEAATTQALDQSAVPSASYEPLAEGYVYVTEDDLANNFAAETDHETLSRQLFFYGTEEEKRSLKDRLEDHQYQRALAKEERRQAEILAGIQAMRRQQAGQEEPASSSQFKASKPLLIGSLSLLGLVVGSGILVTALSGANSVAQEEELRATLSPSPSSSSQPSSSAAPSPSFNTKVPEVNYLDSGQVVADPGSVDYLAPSQQEILAPQTQQNQALEETTSPVSQSLRATDQATASAQASETALAQTAASPEPSAAQPSLSGSTSSGPAATPAAPSSPAQATTQAYQGSLPAQTPAQQATTNR
ncbi:MAG: hypothetical protein Q4C74_00370 [Rothia sp. (in: high G+C Gram-positive bacteria)]|nr:hypothetical protein [Rothia sp. (in: high G+C Gram-positive bacteria)]